MISVLVNIMVCIGFEHVNNVCLLLIIPFRLVLFHRDRINKATWFLIIARRIVAIARTLENE